MQSYHTPVMVEEIVEFLMPGADKVYLDGTLGTGGHTEAILKRSAPSGRVLGIDADAESIEIARERLAPFGDRVAFFHGRYDQAREMLSDQGMGKVDGVLLDLGISKFLLEMSERGFSFSRDDPLDMRMDRSAGIPAAEFLKGLSEEEMVHLFRTYGEERWARRIAGAIVRKRKTDGNIGTTLALAETIRQALPGKYRRSSRIHPATRCFQAIRIAVNRELEALENFLEDLPDLLLAGGRCCIISFHSLEDRIVKRRFREWEREARSPDPFQPVVEEKEVPFRRVRKKVVKPSREEVLSNPLSRSARLRIAERV